MCGAGMVVRIALNHSFWLRMDVGRSTNTIVKLLALWGLLYFASERHFSGLHVMGDSKAIVDCALGIVFSISSTSITFIGNINPPRMTS